MGEKKRLCNGNYIRGYLGSFLVCARYEPTSYLSNFEYEWVWILEDWLRRVISTNRIM